jgi:soluble lytic murein transglycosylase-like protein
MSILSALKTQSSSIDDLAKLPQAMIMQMAQKKQISEDMLAPILSRKAELAEAFARQNALKNAGQTPPTVMEQLMAQNAQAEQPQMPPQMPQQEMPQDMGVAQLPIPERQYAGGGIIAFADGGLSDEDQDYEDALEEADYNAMIESAMNAGEEDYTPAFETKQAKGSPQSFPNSERSVGIASARKESKDDIRSRLLSTIMQKESGGRRYDKNGNLLTSSKGAEGEMQVMPYTSRDPGFGVKPARNNSPDELKRVGDDYAMAMYSRYGDPKLAMIAYNMGPGATDKWLAAGADPRKLPKETQGYIRGVNLAQGGEVKHFYNGGTMGGFDTSYTDIGIPVRPEIDEYTIDPATGEKSFSGYRGKSATKKSKKEAQNTTAPAMPQAGFSADEMIAGSTRAGTLDALMNDQTTGRALSEKPKVSEAPKSRLDQYMERMLAREKSIERQRGDDKNMALLTAGLGMLGGTSQYALENIGKGALAGVQNFSEARKQRGAEQSALDKSMLYATRYQGAEDIAKQNALYNQNLQGQRLEETRRSNTNKEVEQAQNNLNNYVKIAQANLKDRFPAGETDPAYQAAMAQIYKSPQYIALSRRAGLDIAPQESSFAGFSAKMR